MTDRQRLELRQSELRQAFASLAALPELDDEQRAAADRLEAEHADVERQLRAAIRAEGEAAQPDSQERERRGLQARAAVADIFQAAGSQSVTRGATAELQAELGLDPNQVPLALLASPEVRAVTPAPSTSQLTEQPVRGEVFPMSLAAWLGIPRPMVPAGRTTYPVLSTGATVSAPAENASVSETSGAFTAEAISPSRLQASFFASREDLAGFRGMEMALRTNLSEALTDGLDGRLVTGLFSDLTKQTVSAQTNYNNYRSLLVYGRVDGAWAMTASDIRLVMGAGTYAHASAQWRGTSVGDESALDSLMRASGGIRVSPHIAAPDSNNKQDVLVRRGMRPDAYLPMWDGVTILVDPYSRSDTGQIEFTGILLFGFGGVRSGGFRQQQVQVGS